ncbi:MAG: hypothetical protein IKZ95_03550 [Lachnospiraceae bacterium]|nr:hypothetical protein [Lachnospiraceae bacterium]
MKKRIRLLSVILILILVCAMLCGCGLSRLFKLLGGGKEKETTAQPTTQEVTTQETTTKEAATEPTTQEVTAQEATTKEVPTEVVTSAGNSTAEKELTLDTGTQYEANIFLSNFAEQYSFTDFNIYTYSGEQVIDFVHRFAKINEYGAISYDDLYEVITLDYVQTVADRFFGLTLSASDYIDLPAPTYSFEGYVYDGPYYKDGKFYYPAADGATFTDFAVVYKILSFPDGHLEMAFRRYARLDYDMVGGLTVTDAQYRLTLAAAEADQDLLNIGNGYAYVYPKTYNGHNTYQLIEYHEYGLGGIEDY